MKTTYGHVIRRVEDCSSGGVTSREKTIVVFSADTTDEEIEKELIKYPNMVKEDVLRIAKHKDYVYAEVVFQKPKSEYTYCAGGNYITGDSNFKRLTGIRYPISVHDRAETWAVYDTLSR